VAASPGGLAVAAGVTALGVFFVAGALGVGGEAEYAGVGPRAMPYGVGLGLIGLGLTYGVAAARGRVEPSPGPPTDHARLAWIVAGFALAIVLINPLGFPFAAAAVFTLTTRAFGSRRLVRDLLVGAVLGVLIVLVFARGLGVSLPGGWLG
jgi:putative tricarboxylic transport membrane protein